MEMQVKAYTISQITNLLKRHLEKEFFEVWVEGEISDLREPYSGHVYFILKDKSAQLRCVIFKGSRRFVRFKPQDGMLVLARGNITVYERRGEYQFICDYLEPLGSGALQIAFEQLKNRLAKEGLFDESLKKPIPLWPERIGIVTSPTGAAIRDILNVITRRFANVQVLINPVRVQGEGAAEEIANAIKELEMQPGIEVVIIARGGGSLEDLWAFNEEVVARAVYNCRIPVISAVGHEIDYTICDFVADLRAPTPSAAAELVIQKREQMEKHLGDFEKRLVHAFKHRFHMSQIRAVHLMQSRVFRDPWTLIRGYQESLDDFGISLFKAFSYYVSQKKERLGYKAHILYKMHPLNRINSLLSRTAKLTEKLVDIVHFGVQNKRQGFEGLMLALNALSPLNVLERGYCICWKLPGKNLIRRDNQIYPGDFVELKFSKGGAVCEVKKRKGK